MSSSVMTTLLACPDSSCCTFTTACPIWPQCFAVGDFVATGFDGPDCWGFRERIRVNAEEPIGPTEDLCSFLGSAMVNRVVTAAAIVYYDTFQRDTTDPPPLMEEINGDWIQTSGVVTSFEVDCTDRLTNFVALVTTGAKYLNSITLTPVSGSGKWGFDNIRVYYGEPEASGNGIKEFVGNQQREFNKAKADRGSLTQGQLQDFEDAEPGTLDVELEDGTMSPGVAQDDAASNLVFATGTKPGITVQSAVNLHFSPSGTIGTGPGENTQPTHQVVTHSSGAISLVLSEVNGKKPIAVSFDVVFHSTDSENDLGVGKIEVRDQDNTLFGYGGALGLDEPPEDFDETDIPVIRFDEVGEPTGANEGATLLLGIRPFTARTRIVWPEEDAVYGFEVAPGKFVLLTNYTGETDPRIIVVSGGSIIHSLAPTDSYNSPRLNIPTFGGVPGLRTQVITLYAIECDEVDHQITDPPVLRGVMVIHTEGSNVSPTMIFSDKEAEDLCAYHSGHDPERVSLSSVQLNLPNFFGLTGLSPVGSWGLAIGQGDVQILSAMLHVEPHVYRTDWFSSNPEETVWQWRHCSGWTSTGDKAALLIGGKEASAGGLLSPADALEVEFEIGTDSGGTYIQGTLGNIPGGGQFPNLETDKSYFVPDDVDPVEYPIDVAVCFSAGRIRNHESIPNEDMVRVTFTGDSPTGGFPTKNLHAHCPPNTATSTDRKYFGFRAGDATLWNIRRQSLTGAMLESATITFTGEGSPQRISFSGVGAAEVDLRQTESCEPVPPPAEGTICTVIDVCAGCPPGICPECHSGTTPNPLLIHISVSALADPKLWSWMRSGTATAPFPLDPMPPSSLDIYVTVFQSDSQPCCYYATVTSGLTWHEWDDIEEDWVEIEEPLRLRVEYCPLSVGGDFSLKTLKAFLEVYNSVDDTWDPLWTLAANRQLIDGILAFTVATPYDCQWRFAATNEDFPAGLLGDPVIVIDGEGVCGDSHYGGLNGYGYEYLLDDWIDAGTHWTPGPGYEDPANWRRKFEISVLSLTSGRPGGQARLRKNIYTFQPCNTAIPVQFWTETPIQFGGNVKQVGDKLKIVGPTALTGPNGYYCAEITGYFATGLCEGSACAIPGLADFAAAGLSIEDGDCGGSEPGECAEE